MSQFYLQNGSILTLQGKDAVSFLHNLVSQDILSIQKDHARFSCLLTSKSKLVAFFQVWMRENQIDLFMESDFLEPCLQTLDQYLITEDVAMTKHDRAYALYTHESGQDLFLPTSIHFEKPNISNFISDEEFEVIRITSGYPLYKKDYTDPIPFEVPFMHQAISTTKGCFVGQETIARLFSRGLNVNKKLMRISCEQAIVSGDEIYMEDQKVGYVTSCAKKDQEWIGLAWIARGGFQSTNLLVNKNPIRLV